MLKSKKLLSMLLAVVMMLSMGCVGVFAEDYENSYFAEDGTQVTIYDPNISVEFPETVPYVSIPETSAYIQAAGSQYGNPTTPFMSDTTGAINFAVTLFNGGPTYNVSLVKQLGSTPRDTDPVMAVLENRPTNSYFLLSGLTNNQKFYFRLSTWGTPGEARYIAYSN